jgi:hypothetical protein
MQLRPALTPPPLDPALIDRLAKLADRLDGARPADCDEVLAMLARFNQLSGVAMEWHAFQGFNGATSPEDFVRDILHRKTLVPDPELTREEMAEIVSRIVSAGPDHVLPCTLLRELQASVGDRLALLAGPGP